MNSETKNKIIKSKIKSKKFKPQILIISGTPGTGKSILAKTLIKDKEFKNRGWYRLDLHQYYKLISTSYNNNKKCYDINLKKFQNLVKKELEKYPKLIIDSHISHLLPKKLVSLCIILTCNNLKELKRRLQKRKYSLKKIRENLDAEIFQICLTEAQKKKYPIIIYDTSGKTNKSKNILKFIAKIKKEIF